MTCPTPGGPKGILGGQQFKSPGNFMNCPEHRGREGVEGEHFSPTPPGGVGVGDGVGVEVLGVNISNVREIS